MKKLGKSTNTIEIFTSTLLGIAKKLYQNIKASS